MKGGADVVVATPGRLIDFMNDSTLSLACIYIQYLIPLHSSSIFS